MVLLYHYTDAVGKDGIYSAGRIYANDSGDGLGRVVKFTELPHGAPKADLVADIWGASPPPNALDRLRYWFKFELEDLPPSTFKVIDLKRKHLWTSPVDVPLQSPGSSNPSNRQGRKSIRGSPGSQRRQRRQGSQGSQGSPESQQNRQSRQNSRVFYYYTDAAGRDTIYRHGYINTSFHATQLKSGVYLTDVKPTEDVAMRVKHVLGVKYPNADDLAKTKYWFKFDRAELPELNFADKAGRRLWMSPIALKISKPPGSSGSRDPALSSSGRLHKQSSNGPPTTSLKRHSSHSSSNTFNQSSSFTNSSAWQLTTNKHNQQQASNPAGNPAHQLGIYPEITPSGVPQGNIPSPTLSLYHYTDRAGKDRIVTSGCIAPPINGVSVIFAEVAPTSQEEVLWHLFQIRDASRTDLLDKVRYWFEFDMSALAGAVKTSDPQGRDLWAVAGDVDVGLSKRQGQI